MKKSTASAFACIVTSVILGIVALAGFVVIQPRFGEGTYVVHEEGVDNVADLSPQSFSYPLRHWHEKHVVSGQLSMWLSPLHPTIFRVYPDDCLEIFRVNDGGSTDGSQYCDYRNGHDLDWSSFVKAGDNTVYFSVRNVSKVGGFSLSVSSMDPVALLFTLLGVASVVLFMAASFFRWGTNSHHRVLLSLFWGGALLRLAYVIRTPLGLRSYDFDGHVDYVMHVLTNFTVPHAQAGWQYYQPPLYYFFNALFLFPLNYVGASENFLVRVGQFVSLGISWIALGLAIWISLLLFRTKAQRLYAYLFISFIAVFPGIVYMSSRISNDALIVPLSFAFLGFLLRWWRTGVTRDALFAALFLAFGVLTKSNFFAYLPVFAFVVLLRRGTKFKYKVVIGCLSALILVVVTGWYFILRVGMEQERHVVGNISNNAPGLRVEIKPENFFIFRPNEVLKVPYAQSWSDHAGRNRFWEHLLKTAHTGEWNFGLHVHMVMRPMLALSMLLLIFGMARGLYLLWFDAYGTVVLWLTSVLLIFSMMTLVIMENVGGFQDFRYVPGLIVPVTWYVLDGIRVLPRAFRLALIVLFCSFIALSLVFYYVLLFL